MTLKSGNSKPGLYLGGTNCERTPMHTPEAFPLTRGALHQAITGPEAVGLGIIGVGVILLVIALVLLAIVHNRRRDRMR